MNRRLRVESLLETIQQALQEKVAGSEMAQIS